MAKTGVKTIAGEPAPLLGVIKFTLPERDLYQVTYDVTVRAHPGVRPKSGRTRRSAPTKTRFDGPW
jgi:hypothetical protein